MIDVFLIGKRVKLKSIIYVRFKSNDCIINLSRVNKYISREIFVQTRNVAASKEILTYTGLIYLRPVSLCSGNT